MSSPQIERSWAGGALELPRQTRVLIGRRLHLGLVCSKCGRDDYLLWESIPPVAQKTCTSNEEQPGYCVSIIDMVERGGRAFNVCGQMPDRVARWSCFRRYRRKHNNKIVSTTADRPSKQGYMASMDDSAGRLSTSFPLRSGNQSLLDHCDSLAQAAA